MRKSSFVLFLALQFWCVMQVKAQEARIFPLALSSNKRHLVTRQQVPFLIREISAWGLIQSLPESEEAAFMDSILQKGFNTVLTCIVINHRMMAGNPPDWQGNAPFLKKWDFSTPNPLYFEHVDRFFRMASERNLLVLALPVYLGYRDDPGQGWWDEILGPGNDSAKMKAYGEFLGSRYRAQQNLIWVAGGDNNASGALYPYIHGMIDGIRANDPSHLWTGHFDANLRVNWSTGNPLYAGTMDIDGLYVWTESAMGEKGPQYVAELDQYRKGKMIMQLDQSYEHDVPHYADNENHQWIRRKMYEGLLCGEAGTSFSPGDTANQCYTFKNWKPLMSTQGMKEASYCFRLFAPRPWHELVPDRSDSIILDGRGSWGQLSYACAAGSGNGKLYIIYIPTGRTLTVNTRAINSRSMHGFWYDPRSGGTLEIGQLPVADRFVFSTPSEDDWVLVLELSHQMPTSAGDTSIVSSPLINYFSVTGLAGFTNSHKMLPATRTATSR